jgi:predicted DNA-binding WGR domain protein
MSASGVCTRLETCDTNGDKFWEVTVEGSSTAIRQGLIGAECAAEDKAHSDQQTAQAFATAQAAAKRALGYFDSVQLLGRTVPDGPFLTMMRPQTRANVILLSSLRAWTISWPAWR